MLAEYSSLLIVSDCNAGYDLLSSHLQKYGYTVIGAHTGQQALAMLQIQRYDAILLAINLSSGDAMQALQTIKADDMLQSIPVLMIATAADMPQIEQCVQAGAEDFVDPFASMTLTQLRIYTCLERARNCHHLFVNPAHQIMLIKIENDLQIGHNIQASFLPKELPCFHGWKVADCYQPAREVGGDLYDTFWVTCKESGPVGLIIGDVCDKGIGAALFMALFRSLFRVAAQHYALPNRVSPKSRNERTSLFAVGASLLQTSFELVNHYFIDNHGEEGYFATLFFGLLDPGSGTLLYINGGHLPALIVGANSVKARLTATGPAVGLMRGANFAIHQALIEPGDILFTYTDGVTDARDSSCCSFGEAQLLKLLEHPTPSAKGLVEGVHRTLIDHIANTEQYDDITMLAVERA